MPARSFVLPAPAWPPPLRPCPHTRVLGHPPAARPGNLESSESESEPPTVWHSSSSVERQARSGLGPGTVTQDDSESRLSSAWKIPIPLGCLVLALGSAGVPSRPWPGCIPCRWCLTQTVAPRLSTVGCDEMHRRHEMAPVKARSAYLNLEAQGSRILIITIGIVVSIYEFFFALLAFPVPFLAFLQSLAGTFLMA